MDWATIDLSQPLSSARGLDPADAGDVRDLMALWQSKRARNELRDRYYLCHVPIKDLGVAIPPRVASRLRTRVDWPRKVVAALASRSQFDGYAGAEGDAASELEAIVASNRMLTLYRRALVGQLKHCCAFWEVTGGEDGPVVSCYPATAACALWDDSLKSVRAGLVVVESRRRRGGGREPTVVRVHTRSSVITLRRTGTAGAAWAAAYKENPMGRPLMEAMPFEPTLERPFGRSRITRSVMSITDDAIRERARMEVAAESAALPQMWLLGTARRVISEENRYDASMGAINEVLKDEDGDSPSVWQSAQLSMQPHAEYMRSLAAQLAGDTNVPLSELGVVSDNPSSAEAIYAAKEALVIEAQNLNADNGEALRNVALMALAASHGAGSTWASERAAQPALAARFRNPAMPSVVTQSDAVVKQVSAIPWIGDTEVALEELGYSGEQIRRMQSDRRRAQGRAILAASTGAGVDATTITTSETRPGDGAQQG